MFTRDRFDTDLTAKKSKDRRAKLEELLKMSMSGDEDTEASTMEESSSTTDSDSNDKHRNDETASESSTSESESEEEPQAKKRKETRTGWKDTLKDRDEATPEKGKVPEFQDTDEVEELVDRLAKMKVSDSDYARIYYRALKRDAAIANIVAPPAKRDVVSENLPSRNNSRTERTPSRDTPRNMYCFGCGKDDHMLRQCPTVNERIEKGHIKKDEYGRLTHKDGTYIRWMGTETFEDAIRRTTMSSNLVTINMFKADSESEDEDEAYVEYFQMDEETDLEKEYNDDAYTYYDQVSVNAAT
ncbi:uncharacterized protein ARMOST_21658 [Armillaria ostoyae]|uniref:CCHC-type domain-containing protein n=1 Tax=Armillaria ostoyae TaxID=47428 RepID=A0A284SAU8_ARMOS|nr:uncharacterized protein ARMOST_21658 [Armillaria ostoyae]